MRKQSLLQTNEIKRCFITEQWRGDDGEDLHVHHVLTGNPLREWADKEGLWVYLTPQIHAFLHSTQKGVQIQKHLFKPLAQAVWMLSKMPPELVEEAKAEWMETVRKNYL